MCRVDDEVIASALMNPCSCYSCKCNQVFDYIIVQSVCFCVCVSVLYVALIKFGVPLLLGCSDNVYWQGRADTGCLHVAKV